MVYLLRLMLFLSGVCAFVFLPSVRCLFVCLSPPYHAHGSTQHHPSCAVYQQTPGGKALVHRARMPSVSPRKKGQKVSVFATALPRSVVVEGTFQVSGAYLAVAYWVPRLFCGQFPSRPLSSRLDGVYWPCFILSSRTQVVGELVWYVRPMSEGGGGYCFHIFV